MQAGSGLREGQATVRRACATCCRSTGRRSCSNHGLRRSRGVPPPPEGEGTLLGRAAALGHWALYALMVLMPVSGLVAWFGGVDTAGEAHEVMSNLMLFVLAVHVAAALWHQFWLKDHLLLRMMRAER